MQLERKAKIYGVTGTILFLIALLLLLWFSVFSYIIPTGEQGLSMQLGVDAEGGNDFFAAAPADYASDLSAYQQSEPFTGEEELQTQDIEESITLSEKKEKTPEELRREQEMKEQQRQKELERQEEQRKIAEAKAKKEAQDKAAAEIGNRTKNVFDTGAGGVGGTGDSNTSSGQGGTGKGTGDGGNPFGTLGGTGTGGGNGTGGNGSRAVGSSYSLAERERVGEDIKPAYNVSEEGKIVVSIIVDNDGTVITARIGRGTNIDDPTLRSATIEAAQKTKFNKITSDKNQSGTITYIFNLQ